MRQEQTAEALARQILQMTTDNTLAELAERGNEADPFANGSAAVMADPATPVNAQAAASAPAVAAPVADPFADPGAANTPPAPVAAAPAVDATVNPDDVVDKPVSGLFGGPLKALGQFATATDLGAVGGAVATLAAVGGNGGGDSNSDTASTDSPINNPQLQGAVTQVATGLDAAGTGTPIESYTGLVAQTLLNVVPGGADSSLFTSGRADYPTLFAIFGPGASQAQTGFDQTVGQILTTGFNDQLTASLLPIASTVGTTIAQQPLITTIS